MIAAGWRRFLLAALILLLAVGGYFAWRHRQGATEDYPTAKAARGSIRETVSALGVLAPSEYVDVGAQVSGQLIELKVGLGDEVKEGQLIAQIDPTQYAAQVAVDRATIADLTAQLASWEAKLTLAKWTWQRNVQLAPQGGATEQALEQSRSDLKVAEATIASLKAQIDKAKATLKVDEANLDYTRITAPISGIVMTPTSAAYGNNWSKLDIAHVGQVLNNRQNAPVLLRIGKLERMIVRAQVSEADVPRLSLGMPAYFTTLGRQDRRIDATLQSLEMTPELINGAIFYDAVLEVPNPDRALLPQMSAQVFFIVAQADDALTVPLAALSSVQRSSGIRLPGCPPRAPAGTDCVFVMAQGRMQPRTVKIGIKDEVSAQILDGLSEGEDVVIGTPSLAPRGAGPHSGGGNAGR